jgi:hypothetical protein
MKFQNPLRFVNFFNKRINIVVDLHSKISTLFNIKALLNSAVDFRSNQRLKINNVLYHSQYKKSPNDIFRSGSLYSNLDSHFGFLLFLHHFIRFLNDVCQNIALIYPADFSVLLIILNNFIKLIRSLLCNSNIQLQPFVYSHFRFHLLI